ncbi:amidohydrolase family protein [Dinghuibacter silviterrae]|uniref:Cytosine/adenosine deaminase-related metal-dependent hydrolase n=1 Tax=Dinghuibacter silviterrae TaxID=1539049 RepID=A0A4R8DI48_9BACT|nr:amidohydrolase family protein [Dinghuibacter silviterrae]TDW96620.1 cytosine/adenosine deaminase-related metal-dependent hydrolase [Dinghuibacter silviterrae]
MMVLENLRPIEGPASLRIGIRGGRIAFVGEDGAGPAFGPDRVIDLDGAMIFPGLINSHDHLEFNSFPALGREHYANYVEWGSRIHATCREDIDRVLKIPPAMRVQWGLYKNLLGGVTTVVHHGPAFPLENPCIRVFRECQSIHSVQLEPRWRQRLNNPLQWGRPCVIHIGEGTDEGASREIDRLTLWNTLHRPLVGVHGVAMNTDQAAHFKALVWCPQSNFFLLGRTAAIDQLGRHTALLFGTDSTLTGDWNIWDHLRSARDTGLAADPDIYDMLTTTPARIWGLGGGALAPGCAADLTIARPRGDGWNAFYALDPADIELVIAGGRVRLADGRWVRALTHLGHDFDGWSRVLLEGREKWVPGDLPGLARQILAFDERAEFPFLCET